MAGAHAATPGVRVPWELDGTDLSISTSAGGAANWNRVVSGADKAKLNSDYLWPQTAVSSPSGTSDAVYDFVFPRPLNLSGVYICCEAVRTVTVATYTGGVNPWSGTGGQTVHSAPSHAPTLPATRRPPFRDFISVFSSPGAVMARIAFREYHGLQMVHWYAAPPIGQDLQFLALDGSPLSGSSLDVENPARKQSGEYAFRIRNSSSTRLAESVDVRFRTSSDFLAPPTSLPAAVSPPTPGQLMLSFDRLQWAASLRIPSIGPGADGPPIHLLYGVAPDSALGLWSWQIEAVVGTWR